MIPVPAIPAKAGIFHMAVPGQLRDPWIKSEDDGTVEACGCVGQHGLPKCAVAAR